MLALNLATSLYSLSLPRGVRVEIMAVTTAATITESCRIRTLFIPR